ncbi:twin-arginine translocase subunit TatC [Luteipulveratus sp. YIM 133132]|uniref:Sec-independent protein translocase protein TatC n=1 Tax=Luteipulveratus flavus TaxID=3031728 RepID=A0ABT6CBE0_9MICO|nr:MULTISPECIES: twin-arginine translocase subunit TatC [unclassified Luteipulveratus]MDE9367413.1 twin-arginine translocase subunit TatC [Luteipulveratus sp. YIM 133132]MDF8266206.1 twin-arginine translocase subunit TatC [Luteipulveratus sp. YIM 133296]
MALLGRKNANPEARMSLGDHFREFRNRALVAALAIAIGSAVGWMVYEHLVTFLTRPLVELSKERNSEFVKLNYAGITSAFTLHLKIAMWLGVILASPVWLWQIWAFLVPGLTKKEKKVARLFVAAAVPLFLAGCYAATWALPKAVEVLLGFTPDDAANLPNAGEYFTFCTRFILAFGIAFLLPVFLVGLNTARILPGRIMLKGWRIAIILIFVFAAMMTPTPDAWTMLALALPMVGLYYLACGFSIVMDKRRAKRDRPDWMDVPDDQASAL